MSFLIWPLLACILLVLIHVYFGSFVLKRGVIFIDLALAQWAALGYLLGIVLDIHNHFILFGIGFLFTLIAAFVLSILKQFYQHVNLQEAVIGVVYISGITFATILLSSFGLEGHHLEEMFSGHLIFVNSHDIVVATVLYLFIAFLMVKLHGFISQSYSFWRDFLFYALFGLVVTSSVKMVGVLLVFSYLVIPLISVMLWTKSSRYQIFSAWAFALVLSIVGIASSFFIDMSMSYMIILMLIIGWILSVLLKQIGIKSNLLSD